MDNNNELIIENVENDYLNKLILASYDLSDLSQKLYYFPNQKLFQTDKSYQNEIIKPRLESLIKDALNWLQFYPSNEIINKLYSYQYDLFELKILLNGLICNNLNEYDLKKSLLKYVDIKSYFNLIFDYSNILNNPSYKILIRHHPDTDFIIGDVSLDMEIGNVLNCIKMLYDKVIDNITKEFPNIVQFINDTYFLPLIDMNNELIKYHLQNLSDKKKVA